MQKSAFRVAKERERKKEKTPSLFHFLFLFVCSKESHKRANFILFGCVSKWSLARVGNCVDRSKKLNSIIPPPPPFPFPCLEKALGAENIIKKRDFIRC
jgi:hypothetical protein